MDSTESLAESEMGELKREVERLQCAGTGLRSFFFSSRRRHTRYWRDWSSDVCSSDLGTKREGSPDLPEPSRGAAGRECGDLLPGGPGAGRGYAPLDCMATLPPAAANLDRKSVV